MNVILVGFMGTGKTSVGKRVARELGMTFLDMDDIIEERQAKKISRIFAEDGEAHFRALERELVKELSLQDKLVIATGGGVVLDSRNIANFEKTGVVICLTAEPDTIFNRVAAETHRPLLEGDEKMRGIMSILERRREIYNSFPNRIDTTSFSIEEVAAQVITMTRNASNPA